ncbi:prominin-2 isoform X3 [Meriones unguiculatus]|uniref:prominin-2 isoform X3 n=1 Tax=Meriones unguiculatus TaxID=10047 RepID=UPI000B4EC8C3|nr:prominin-2 isoform X3 [Meriones unguiculatus]XP_021508286.1 prominin-2 isoform X2 [Meriones unguiculatus]XP_021508290.1 prominin-2 isoform X3 [Meriones unguiculatus]XP_021508291.1 prominin-2 isoform X3 [Meriones unguiculatus]
MTRTPGLMVPLLGLSLGLALSLPRAAATDCGSLGRVEQLAFAPAARTRWLAPRFRAPGPLDSLYGTVRRFLSLVQLNPFPSELIRALLNDPPSVKTDEVVRYEAGYVACAVIAGLYLLLVPITGLCFCCCRCRRRCGGRLKTEHKAMACERGTLMTFLLLTTLVLLIGMVCAFATNQYTHSQTGPSVRAVPETLLSLRGLVSDVPQELQAVAEQFSVPQEQVSKELDGVGENLGNIIHNRLKSTVYPVLASVHSLGQALQVSIDHLRALNTTSVELQEGQQHLGAPLQAHREYLLTLLQESWCRGNCQGALSRASALQLGADFSQVPSVDDVLHQLKGVPEANFSSMVQEENTTFNSLPLLVAMQTANVVKDLKKALAEQPEGVRMLAREFPGSEAASRWSQALERLELHSRPYLQEVQRYETYRWILGCVLCSVVLLVVICNLLGLSLGICGLFAREDPSHSETKGEAGARFLMAGVAFSFLFAAPLILLVFATFLVGGNVQTLVCRSWESGELYEFADTPGNLPPSMNLSYLLGLKKNISVLQAYRQCKAGAVLWKVLQLNDSYNLDKHLDIKQYTGKFQQELQRFKVDVKDLDLLTPEARQDLEALRGSGLEKIHYGDFLVQIQKPVVKTDMEQLAQELEGLALAQNDSVLRQQLQEEARELRSLYREKVVPQESLVAKLNLSVRALESSAPNLQVNASDILGNVTYLKGELPAQTNLILRNATECFLIREMDYFSQYVAWVKEEVTQHIATCQPLSVALDNGRVILCDMMADPWNAFWFCLGWCTFLLIPSIIFAVKTSKYFRPIRKRLRVTSLKL